MSTRQFTRRELEPRNTKEDAAFVIDNVVYDVTSFLEDHPGGVEVLLDNAGKDASKCFHDVGHTDDARRWMKRYVIGEVVPEERWEVKRRQATHEGPVEPVSLATLVSVWGPPLALAAAALYIYKLLFA